MKNAAKISIYNLYSKLTDQLLLL